MGTKTRGCRLDQVGSRRRCLVAGPSGVWCVQPQGGGGRQGGALATDDNAADARARPRDPDRIQTTTPEGGTRKPLVPGAARRVAAAVARGQLTLIAVQAAPTVSYSVLSSPYRSEAALRVAARASA
ncbi:hypothetical protein EZV63_25400 [Streptomyces sp. VN1]|nr:hypothetical protein EZV63_25400 [Streptomyces sp. VN1]